MPGSARRDIIREGEIATYHVWTQTAQQRFLLGNDSMDCSLHHNHEHRREWCESLLAYLAKVFAVDIANHNFLDNHFHLMLRTRPDIVAKLSDEEAAFRWALAWPEFDRDHNRWFRIPTDDEIKAVLTNPKKLQLARHGLSSLSWFVGRMKESISREANNEVGAKGHFWSGRFGSRELVDDAAILACSVYVDLNQVRAGMASSLLESKHSAVQSRILQGRMEEAEAAYIMFQSLKESGIEISLDQIQSMYSNCRWIAPVQQTGDLKLVNDAWFSQGNHRQTTWIGPKPCKPQDNSLNNHAAPDEPAVDTTEVDRIPAPLPPGDTTIGESSLPIPGPAQRNAMFSLEDVLNKLGIHVDPRTLCRILEEDHRALRQSPTGDHTACPHSPIDFPEVESTDPAHEKDEAVGNGTGRSANADGSDGESAHRAGKTNAVEIARTSEDTPEQSTQTKEENEKKTKAEPTYEIHNRLFPQLPDRASNSPVIDLPMEQYLKLVLAAADRAMVIRQLKAQGLQVPTEIAEQYAVILRENGINPKAWYATLDAFEHLFCYALGSPKRVEAFAKRAGRRSVHGISACRSLFLAAVQATGVTSELSGEQQADTGPPLVQESPPQLTSLQSTTAVGDSP